MATNRTMTAWQVRRPGPMSTRPLERVMVDIPRPAGDELLVAVQACGVCRTDLHVTEGDLPVHRRDVTPGHEVVGEVVEVGSAVGPQGQFSVGDRVGIAWLRHTCGVCRFCVRGRENLCPESRYTGWDADGGYAEFATVPADFAHRLPTGYSDSELAPLLCAGILFAPVGELVLPALEALDRGGTLAIAGIHLSDIPVLNYQRHLFYERQLRSVTSNTRADAREFLAFAEQHRIAVSHPTYPVDQADRALTDLADGRIAGAAVLLP